MLAPARLHLHGQCMGTACTMQLNSSRLLTATPTVGLHGFWVMHTNPLFMLVYSGFLDVHM